MAMKINAFQARRKKEERYFMEAYEELMEATFKEMAAIRIRLRKQKMKAEADQNQVKLDL
jgi:hypothetical protein